MTIKTQLWKPDTCGCVIMQKWDTDFPERAPEYITADEYLAIIESKKDEPNVVGIDEARKIATRIRVCNEHKGHGHTKKLHEEVLKKNRAENARKEAERKALEETNPV